jgi:hypothetical protein
MSNVTELYPENVLKDLALSGLQVGDVRVRALGPNEKHAVNIPSTVDGYVFPYYSIQGQPIPFYRARLFNFDPKYKQPVNTPNHLYFPPGFYVLASKPDCTAILLVEGEKKAACAVKHGHAAFGVPGVDSWRNRTLHMPKETGLTAGKGNNIVARLPSGTEVREVTDTIAVGLQEIINLIIRRNIPLVIVYDSDTSFGLKDEVATAAATLGYELRYRGIPSRNIRQLVLELPNDADYEGDKLGLDDFLMHPDLGNTLFAERLDSVVRAHNAFPRHPNPKQFVNKKLQRARIPRSEMQQLATAVLCDLDSKGMRLRCPDDEMLYYFDNTRHELIKVKFRLDDNFSKSAFGRKIYSDYNLGITDFRLIGHLDSQFSGEEPIVSVSPEKVITSRGDSLYYQLTKSKMIRISADQLRIQPNGSDSILFESESVESVNEAVFISKMREIQAATQQGKPHPNIWYEVLKHARIAKSEDDRTRKLLSLLYSISPWFYRWRGTQLPFEMMLGENGSGKSSIFILRQQVLTGKPRLRNAPSDMKSWAASVYHTGGLHVTDNLHLSHNSIRQELSDELCRIITEPNPRIETRKLYTDNDLIEVPVKTIFAVTAIQQPFTNADLIARSIITRLDKGAGAVEFDGHWSDDQLYRHGGREGWIANQVAFLQRLLRLVREKWQPRYKAKYRLVNMEQLLMLAAEVYGWDGSWIPDFLEATRAKTVTDTDFALSGLKAWAEIWRREHGDEEQTARFWARDISNWAQRTEPYDRCEMLINSHKLSNYMRNNANTLTTIVGITELGTRMNAATYFAHPPRT